MVDFSKKCFYCERIFGIAPYGHDRALVATKDHIVPRSKGGRSIKENYVPCCTACNSYKGNWLLEDWIPKVQRRINKELGYGGITFERLHLVVKNATVLLDAGSKNTNPEIIAAIPKKKKRSFHHEVTLSVNDNTPRRKVAPKVTYVPPKNIHTDVYQRWLSEPEPDFHEKD